MSLIIFGEDNKLWMIFILFLSTTVLSANWVAA
jgi:hypothetical protein